MLFFTVVSLVFNLLKHMIESLKWFFIFSPHCIFKLIFHLQCPPKCLLSSAHNHGRQSVSKDTEITLLQDGMTVRLVTISVKSSPTLILHKPVIMGESFYSLLPYLCSGYPRLASQELAFYHAYCGGWRNRCGIPWPACHAIYLLAEFHCIHSWTLGHNQRALACHGHLKNAAEIWA